MREIQASLAEALRAAAKFDECTEVVERIYEKDPNTRHLNMLPLVWDERLLPEHRISVTQADLKSPSLLRQLVAASALLQDPTHETNAAAVLQTLKTGPRRTPATGRNTTLATSSAASGNYSCVRNGSVDATCGRLRQTAAFRPRIRHRPRYLPSMTTTTPAPACCGCCSSRHLTRRPQPPAPKKPSAPSRNQAELQKPNNYYWGSSRSNNSTGEKCCARAT